MAFTSRRLSEESHRNPMFLPDGKHFLYFAANFSGKTDSSAIFLGNVRGNRNSPPAAALTQPVPQPYKPPPITTFSDRVNNAIQAYPLEKGIGNNPTDQQMFIRQRLNQQ